MSSPPIILLKQHELVIALNRKIIFVNPNDLQIFKEVEIEADLVPLGLKLSKDDNDDESKTKKPKSQEEAKIQHVALSDDLQWLAVTTSGQKALLLFNCLPVHAKLVSIRPIPRASSALIFSPSGSSVLVCDKTGDCYQFDVSEDSQNPGKLVLGHLSIVYDVLFPPGENHIITSDRDEKIRVTNYPNSYEIANYCLGHKEYVSSIKLLPGQEDSNKLVSLSGDETLKVWNYLTGEQLGNLDLPAPGIKLAIRKKDDHFELAILVFHPTTQLLKYKMNQETFCFSEISKHDFTETIPVDLCFIEDRLFVATLSRTGKLQMEIFGEEKPNSSSWKEMVRDYFKDESCEYSQEEDVTGWFKKKYDNLTEYYDRKKKRMCV